jgi:hypothetical protein
LRYVAALCVVVLLVLALAATGADRKITPFPELPGPQVARQTIAEMRALTSYTVRGELIWGNDRVDVTMARESSGRCSGKAVFGAHPATFVRQEVDGSWLLKGDAGLYLNMFANPKKGRRVAALYADRWIRVPPLDPDDRFAAWCDANKVLADYAGDDADQCETDDRERIGGHDALEIVCGENTQFWVRMEPPHRVLRVRRLFSDGDEDVMIDSFDPKISVPTPQEEDVVDLSGEEV